MSQMKPFATHSTPSFFADVIRFHMEVLNQEPSAPHTLDLKLGGERYAFMKEELQEFREAYLHDDTVGAADALADIVYVALGTAYLMGLPFGDIWDAVQRANMRKVPGFTKRGMPNDAKKPEGWVGPEAEIAMAIQECQTS